MVITAMPTLFLHRPSMAKTVAAAAFLTMAAGFKISGTVGGTDVDLKASTWCRCTDMGKDAWTVALILNRRNYPYVIHCAQLSLSV